MTKKYDGGASERFRLIEEYEEALLAGKNPNPKDYLNCYTGPKKDLLILGLNIATLFLTGKGMQRRESASKLLQKAERTGELQASKEGLLRKIISKNR